MVGRVEVEFFEELVLGVGYFQLGALGNFDDQEGVLGLGIEMQRDILMGDVGVLHHLIVVLDILQLFLYLLDALVQTGLLLAQLRELLAFLFYFAARLRIFQTAHPLYLVLEHLLDVADSLQHVRYVVDSSLLHSQLANCRVQVDYHILLLLY